MMRSVNILLALLLLGGLAGALPAAAQQEALGVVQVRILPEVEIPGELMSLGEVAELDGFDMDAVRRLSRINLGRAPRPGGRLRLTESQVRFRIHRAINPKRVDLRFPEEVWVTRASQVIAGVDIERRVRGKAIELAGVKEGTLELTLVTPLRDVVLPLGAVQWDIKPLGKKLIRGGSRTFKVVARVNGQGAWRSLVRVRQRVLREVVVAARPIQRDRLIGEADLRVETRDVSTVKSGRFLSSLSQAVGRTAKRPIGQDEWIHEDMVVAPLTIKEGGRVTLEFRTRLLRFRVPGVALVSGGQGQFIPVRNLQSGKIVHGVVESNDTVRVN